MYRLRYLGFHKLLIPIVLVSFILSFILVYFNVPVILSILCVVSILLLSSGAKFYHGFLVNPLVGVGTVFFSVFLGVLKKYLKSFSCYLNRIQANIFLTLCSLFSFFFSSSVFGYIFSLFFQNEVYLDFYSFFFYFLFAFLIWCVPGVLIFSLSTGSFESEKVFKIYLSLSLGEDFTVISEKFNKAKNIYPPELDEMCHLDNGICREMWVWWVDWEVKGQSAYIYLTFDNGKLVSKSSLLDT